MGALLGSLGSILPGVVSAIPSIIGGIGGLLGGGKKKKEPAPRPVAPAPQAPQQPGINIVIGGRGQEGQTHQMPAYGGGYGQSMPMMPFGMSRQGPSTFGGMSGIENPMMRRKFGMY